MSNLSSTSLKRIAAVKAAARVVAGNAEHFSDVNGDRTARIAERLMRFLEEGR